ncbi:MBL fold metallo-hydrolase [Sagittula sp. NFXS13]|uniref:MBL fold metallo-hydrolase n=1 Tax=Sagittula sp. NFXS13 TaxID=2819095 RepID=UPI0032DE3126
MDGSLHPIRTPFDTPPEHGAAVEVADGVLWMRLPLPMKLDHVNVYALDDGDGWTVVDTGMASDHSRAIWETLRAGPLGGKPINRVLVTHHHPDHVGLAGWFYENGAQVVASRTAWLLARMLQQDPHDAPTPEIIAYWRAAGMAEDVIAERMTEPPYMFRATVHPMPYGHKRLAQGDTFVAGGRTWDVHSGGGHAPEHLTLWSRDDMLIVAGDQVLPSISPNLGVYATEPEADPVADWLETCTRFQPMANEDHLVLGGHKLPFTGLPARLKQMIDNHHTALSRLEAHLTTPATAAECFHALFKRRIRPDEYGLALVEAMAHCLHLWHEGRATREICADGAWRFRCPD